MDSFQVHKDKGIVQVSPAQVPIAGEFDVIVAGGGPAGCGAALGAVRQGATTLLIERHGFVGGVATGVAMNTWNCPLEHLHGVAKEVTLRLLEQGYAWAGPTIPFDPEGLKEVYLEKLLEAGVQLLCYTWVVDPIVIDGHLRGVIVQSKSGRQALLAKAVVDATGDADVAYRAGVPCVKGREKDGKMRGR